MKSWEGEGGGGGGERKEKVGGRLNIAINSGCDGT